MAGLVVGVPKEIKEKEGRVSVQPDGVDELVYDGREVVVQAGAGRAVAFPTTSTLRPAPGLSAAQTRCLLLRT